MMIKLSIGTFLMVLSGGSYLITYGMYADSDVRQWFRVQEGAWFLKSGTCGILFLDCIKSG